MRVSGGERAETTKTTDIVFSRSTGHNSSFIFSFFKSETTSNESDVSRHQNENSKNIFTPFILGICVRTKMLWAQLGKPFSLVMRENIKRGQILSNRKHILCDNAVHKAGNDSRKTQWLHEFSSCLSQRRSKMFAISFALPRVAKRMHSKYIYVVFTSH